MTQSTKRQAKKERSRRAKAERRAVEQRARRLRSARRIGVSVLVTVVVVGLVGGTYAVTTRERRVALARIGDQVVTERYLGREHIEAQTTAAAPTSGPHLAGPVCGVVSQPVPPQSQIHALEHGAVAFQYREGDVGAEDIAALADLADELRSHVLVAPNPGIDAPLVATAWTKKMRLDAVDIDALRDFAAAFQGRGPEDVDCPI